MTTRRRAKTATVSVNDRVRQLVETRFIGSVNAAAKSWGIPQPTLRRIVGGQSASPRADALAKIARATGTTVEWLLTGEGTAPVSDPERPRVAAVEEWDRLVAKLMKVAETDDAWGQWKLSREDENLVVESALGSLPYAPFITAHHINPQEPAFARTKVAYEALESSARHYTRIFEEAIAEKGAEYVLERVRLRVIDLLLGLAWAWGPFGFPWEDDYEPAGTERTYAFLKGQAEYLKMRNAHYAENPPRENLRPGETKDQALVARPHNEA